MKIGIIGTGIYGIALAMKCSINGHTIKMWSENEKLVQNIKENNDFKPFVDVKVPNNIKVTNDLEYVLKDVELVILVTSAKYVRSICLEMKKYYQVQVPICIATKGIENETCNFLSDVVKSILKSKYMTVLSGPTFAIDLINNEPCALSLATNSKKATKLVGNALCSDNLKLRVNNDLYGTQICGSIKNVIAIAAGIIDGMGYTESTRAFLITEALHDIKELLDALECNPKTVLSFAGIGDLILTCSSPKSRNYKFGMLLGKNASKEEIEEYLKNNTTEGYYTLLSIKELTKNRKIKMPIINVIYNIVVNEKNSKTLTEFLVSKY